MPISKSRRPATINQFGMFSAIGVVGFIVDTAVLYAALAAVTSNPYLARVLSYLAAATTTWALNRNLTFHDRRSSRPHREWAAFVAVNGVGGAVNYLVYSAVVFFLSAEGLFPLLGVALGSIAGLVFNFSLSKLMVFRSSPAEAKSDLS